MALMMNSDDGISAFPDSDNMLNWCAYNVRACACHRTLAAQSTLLKSSSHRPTPASSRGGRGRPRGALFLMMAWSCISAVVSCADYRHMFACSCSTPALSPAFASCSSCISSSNSSFRHHYRTATITGTQGTPYEGLSYSLTLAFPANYPCSPPVYSLETHVWIALCTQFTSLTITEH